MTWIFDNHSLSSIMNEWLRPSVYADEITYPCPKIDPFLANRYQ